VTDADTRANARSAPPMNGGADGAEIGATDAALDGDLDPESVAAERDAYLDQLQRSRAEFANYRRRTEGERALARALANQTLLAQFLPVFDDLQRAVAAVPDARDDPLVQGLRLIERKFWGLLERQGVTPIDATGQPFDPTVHEAVDSVPGSAADTVVEVYQGGYRLGQTLLRPAMVKVGDGNID